MNIKKRLSFIIFALILSICAASNIQAADNKVKVVFFYGEGCPHCSLEKPFLVRMSVMYPEIEVVSFEIWKDKENAKLLSEVAEAYGVKVSGIPATFIGDYAPVIGYISDETSGREIESKIKACIRKGCPDPLQKLKTPLSRPAQEQSTKVNIPGMGEVDASKMALPALTVILGGLDSFNPCAFFVLFTLLGILVHAKTRSRMFIIGGVFVFFSGFIYFLFMAAWLNFFLYIGEFKAVTIAAGIIALVIAAINIKDFFFFAKGVSLSIPDSAKPKLFDRMRGLLKATSTASMLFGTIVLAAAANTYELFCTAGFPMVFTRVLTLHGLTTFQYYLYLVLYNVIYIIPLAAIVFTFTMTLGKRKLTERQGQVLKLVSGMMMLCLGAVLLIDPSLFNNIVVSVSLIAVSLGAAWLIVLITKMVGK
ncbi:MAG: thioredoxin [Nitrospirae bacterium]|nr:MAG: thioredoxin [Nitrospirota bacterium]